MDVAFMVLLFILVLLFYFSNRGNKINMWCSVAGLLFWLGVFKEVYLTHVLPYLEVALGGLVSHHALFALYSLQAWAANALATPTTVYMSLYFCGMDTKNPRLMRRIGLAMCVVCVALAFVFPPLSFGEFFTDYGADNHLFWVVYGVYNLALCVLLALFMIRGVRRERPGKVRTQKLLVTLIILPPIYYCLFAVYVVYPFGLDRLFDLWKGNVFLVALCLALYLYMAFREGVMGLRLSRETYNWNSDMDLINKGAEYTSHMLKNQTAKMEWCIENLKVQYGTAVGTETPPEEFAILSRSIAELRRHTEKLRRHSESVQLLEKPCNLKTMLDAALPFPQRPAPGGVTAHVAVPPAMAWLCDEGHMSEVFANLILNGAEATTGAGVIDVAGEYDKGGRDYLLHFTDHGSGMSEEVLHSMFVPYFTTKNTERNFGLGLAYCKNVVEKHGGTIAVKSEPGRGTTVTVVFPSARVLPNGAGEPV